MALRTDHMQTASGDHLLMPVQPSPADFLFFAISNVFTQQCQFRFKIAAQHNVSTTAGHIRRNRHRTRHSGLLDDVSFPLMLLSIQHFMFDILLFQQRGNDFGIFNRSCSD